MEPRGTETPPPGSRLREGPRGAKGGTQHHSPQHSLPDFHRDPEEHPPHGANPPWSLRLMGSIQGPSRAGQGARGLWEYPPPGELSSCSTVAALPAPGGCIRHGTSKAASPPARPEGQAQIAHCGATGGLREPKTGAGWSRDPAQGRHPHPLGGDAWVHIGIGQASSAMAGDHSLLMQGVD